MARPARPWFRLYVEALSDRKLRRLEPAVRWVWIAVLGMARMSPTPGVLLIAEGVPADEDDIADVAGVPARLVAKAMPQFVTARMVGWRDGAWFVVNWDSRQFESDDVTARTAKHRSKERSYERSSSSGGNAPETETETETENPPSSPPAGGTTELTLVEHVDRHPDRFDDFWKAYPRKASKPQARKAWAKAVKRAGAQQIIDGARRHGADPNREDAYTKLPATWLNADAWNDPPLPPRNGTAKGGLAASIDRLRNSTGPRALGTGEAP